MSESEVGGSRTELLPPESARGMRRVLLVTAGLMCVGMAYLGAVLPGLPTTPWVLLASYCFARSSPRLNRWLKRTPFFGKLLHDWHEHRGMRRSAKVLALTVIVGVVSVSLASGRLPGWLNWIVGGLALCGISTIVFLVPTIRTRPRMPHQS